jgi:signal transduction histidine kinase
LGGPRAVSLIGFAIASPFWILGFLFNEDATYESFGSALEIFLIAVIAQIGLGTIFLIAHLTVLKDRRTQPVPLWVVCAVWFSAGAFRAVLLVIGLGFFGTTNEIPTGQRITYSGLMAVVGFGATALALDAIDRFSKTRAEVLRQLLAGEEQLSTHRAAVDTMRQTLLATVGKKLDDSYTTVSEALDRLEESLVKTEAAQPALEELRTLSDKTWQKISEDLWRDAPVTPPRIRVPEFLALYATSRPFQAPYLLAAAGFLYLLVYSRVYEPLVALALLGIWSVGAVVFGLVANWFLARARRVPVSVFFVLAGILLLSSLPLIVLAEIWGHPTIETGRIMSVHAITVFVALSTSLPETAAEARNRILQNLRKHVDNTTLEKLHVESQLKVVSQKIASRLHGDVRGNFLASILKLQDLIARSDIEGARNSIGDLRHALNLSRNPIISEPNDHEELSTFLSNWSALIDLALEKPLSSVPPDFLPAVHTIVVDGVNNAVRHGEADWVRINFTEDQDSLTVTIRNNGKPRQGSNTGLGTAHLNLLAPDGWSLITHGSGVTQLLVKLEKANALAYSASR